MDYISSLRDKVGHAPVILVGALVLIFNKDKQVLLQLRSDNESWGLPGGTMESENLLKKRQLEKYMKKLIWKSKTLNLLQIFQVKIITWSIQMEMKHIL
ncbi:NUDIX domain-containing protein [Mammaliicoccus sciuri]|uniref:NUDIX domain-containing protein n=1 Tax=Mammaliicoccus sciuri TaxID=1296 RepID=UPI002287479D|nr:NUDIX domain-containing protein [Mammaliicoccus sciuri]